MSHDQAPIPSTIGALEAKVSFQASEGGPKDIQKSSASKAKEEDERI